MLPKLIPIQNQYLEEKYGRALDKAEESLALAIATAQKRTFRILKPPLRSQEYCLNLATLRKTLATAKYRR